MHIRFFCDCPPRYCAGECVEIHDSLGALLVGRAAELVRRPPTCAHTRRGWT